MKQRYNIKLIPIYFITFLFIFKHISATIMRENPYAGDTKIRHSLFGERDNKERMSIYPSGVPVVKQE